MIRRTNFSGHSDPRKFLVDRAALREQKALATSEPEVAKRQRAKKGRNEAMIAHIDSDEPTHFDCCNFAQRSANADGTGHELVHTGPVVFRCCNLANVELPPGATLEPDEDGVYGNTSRVVRDVVPPVDNGDGTVTRTHRYIGRYLPDGTFERNPYTFEELDDA